MRKLKKAMVAFLMMCMLWPATGNVANAASAELRFSDPTTTVGAEVEVTVKMTSSAKINTVEAKFTYDESMLRFISGDDATGGNGTITLNGSGGSTSLEYVLKFQALQEGTTKITVSNSQGIDSGGSALEITNGSSSVDIGPGDASLIVEEESTVAATGAQVEVDGVSYVITNEFSETVIPQGFVKGEMEFEGTTCQVVTQETSGIAAFYLAPVQGGDGDFFLYNDGNGSFAPFEEVEIAQGRYLIPLRDDGSVKLPKIYQKTTLTLNDKGFDTWQNTENAEYYIIYALNSDGQKELYQYDTIDKTYQRYTASQKIETAAVKKSADGFWGKILNFVGEFTDIVVIIVCAVVLLLIIVLIVVSVKLRHRDVELDDLYDEYGIDMEEEEESTPKKVSAKKAKASGNKKKREELEDDFEEFEYMDEADLEEEYFEENDQYEEDEYFNGVAYEDFDIQSDFESYEGFGTLEELDELDDLLSEHPEKKRGHAELDDTFKMDIIDLD